MNASISYVYTDSTPFAPVPSTPGLIGRTPLLSRMPNENGSSTTGLKASELNKKIPTLTRLNNNNNNHNNNNHNNNNHNNNNNNDPHVLNWSQLMNRQENAERLQQFFRLARAAALGAGQTRAAGQPLTPNPRGLTTDGGGTGKMNDGIAGTSSALNPLFLRQGSPAKNININDVQRNNNNINNNRHAAGSPYPLIASSSSTQQKSIMARENHDDASDPSGKKSELALVPTLRGKTKATAVKPYLCKTCGNGFKSYSNLLIHSRIHTGKN